jgi:hypothetical protein
MAIYFGNHSPRQDHSSLPSQATTISRPETPTNELLARITNTDDNKIAKDTFQRIMTRTGVTTPELITATQAYTDRFHKSK